MDDVAEQCQKLIARYLLDNGYHSTLAAFQAEAKTATPDASSISLDDVVKLYLQQQELVTKLATARLEASESYAEPFDFHKEIGATLPKAVTRTLREVHLSGILSVTYAPLPQRVFDTSSATYQSTNAPCIATSSTDKRIVFTNVETWEVVDSFEPTTAATLVLKTNPVYPYLMLSGAMDGTCTVTNLLSRESSTFRDHTKYVVRVAWSDDGLWFCSLSYDKSICIYEVIRRDPEEEDDPIDTDDYARLPTFEYRLRWRKTIPTNPEACTFVPGSTHLVYTRRDDNFLNYVELPKHSAVLDAGYTDQDFPVTRYNINENQDAHISFSILSIAVHPSKQALSLQTDTDISRIIVIALHSNERLRNALYTSAEQSSYSNPRHSWLEDGSGVVVSSDDGILRVVDLNGKVKSSIGAHGVAAPQEHEPVPIVGEALRARYQSDRGSSVVRDVCVIPGNRIVSVGLDKTVRVAEP